MPQRSDVADALKVDIVVDHGHVVPQGERRDDRIHRRSHGVAALTDQSHDASSRAEVDLSIQRERRQRIDKPLESLGAVGPGRAQKFHRDGLAHPHPTHVDKIDDPGHDKRVVAQVLHPD